MLVIERCHLQVDALVATPYSAGLSVLADDEAELDVALIDMGGGTTSVGVFAAGTSPTSTPWRWAATTSPPTSPAV